MELLLWLFFLIPGLIYSIWRIASRYAGCPVCKAKNCIPIETPAGQSILRAQSIPTAQPESCPGKFGDPKLAPEL